ncbi:unnamed protein product [marine sediment metagenome]|uniref:Uncharacterized protein n=1 Tax=marine sediment metagenome TaxID=412755 RepID=X1NDP9_9ZZZZ
MKLKPVSPERVIKALEKCRDMLKLQDLEVIDSPGKIIEDYTKLTRDMRRLHLKRSDAL